MSSFLSAPVNSRRKACTPCQQAKRRCDLQLPRCGRCMQKGLKSCSYPSLDTATTSAGGAASFSSPPAARQEHQIPGPLSYFTDVLLGADPMGLAGRGGSVFQDFLSQLRARQAAAAVAVPVVSDYTNPWPIFFHASGPANTSVSRDAMYYCVAQYRTWPARWVTEAFAPFIHPGLYASSGSSCASETLSTGGLGQGISMLPPALQDAFAVCAAYASRTDANSSIVMGLVEAKSAALLYSPDQSTWTLSQQLAALQALLMYQMMRLFDGDIRQRALGEAIEPVLAAWTAGLQSRVGPSIFDGSDVRSDYTMPPGGAGATSGSTGSPISAGSLPDLSMHYDNPSTFQEPAVTSSDDLASAWRRWLFNETVRRTIIMAFTVRGIYAMAKQGYCHLGSVVTDMSFTSHSRLWAATTAGRWRRACNSSDPGWITRMDFSHMLTAVDPSTVDEFTIMMAVLYRGRDVVEDWMTQGIQQSL